MLDEKWCHQKPFAIRCSLIDVQLTYPIDSWSPQQQQQFIQTLQMHDTFYISVNRLCSIASEVFLYYVRDDLFHCVNEMFPSDSSSSDEDAQEVKGSSLLPARKENTSSTGAIAVDVVVATSAGPSLITNERSAKSSATKSDAKTQSASNDDAMNDASRQALTKPTIAVTPNYAITNEKSNISAWLPAETLATNKQYVIVPTHMDKNCIISIVDLSKSKLNEELHIKLNKMAKLNCLEWQTAKWKPKDACFARSSADEPFHRGTVCRVDCENDVCLVS